MQPRLGLKSGNQPLKCWGYRRAPPHPAPLHILKALSSLPSILEVLVFFSEVAFPGSTAEFQNPGRDSALVPRGKLRGGFLIEKKN